MCARLPSRLACASSAWIFTAGVLGVVLGEQALLVVAAFGKKRKTSVAPSEDGDDPGEVRPLVAVEERRLRRR